MTIPSSFFGRTTIGKNGPGTWLLSGDSSYSGNTSINEGALRIASNNALGAAGINTSNWTIVFNGAALEWQGGISVPEHFHFLGNTAAGPEPGAFALLVSAALGLLMPISRTNSRGGKVVRDFSRQERGPENDWPKSRKLGTPCGHPVAWAVTD